jgi:hypothetical protein
VKPDINFKYKKTSFFEYFIKNGKKHAFGATLTLIITFLYRSADKTSDNAARADIEIKIFYLILFLIPFTISIFWFNYKQDREMRRREVTDKLKKESNAYYQSYAEWLTEKLIQKIDIIISAEARRFHETLNNAREIYESYFTTQGQMESQQDVNVEHVKTMEYLDQLHNLKKLIQGES